MNDIKFSSLIKTILVLFLAAIMIACASNKPHQMQDLINKNFLQNVGLTRSSHMLDNKGNEHIKAIHIGTPSDPKVENFMTFNTNGNLIAVRKMKGENLILKLVEFKYDSRGKLTWIVPSSEYFSALDYDSLRIEYRGAKPIKSIAIKKNKEIWTEDIIFDDKESTYMFSRILDNSQNELFNLYRFEGNKISAEYHRNRVSDTNIDSTRYYYNKNNKLYKRSSIFNASTVNILNYDEFERPLKGTTMFYKKDSVAWIDNYYYLLEDRLPHSIITVSPLGWKEEINYFWEEYEK